MKSEKKKKERKSYRDRTILETQDIKLWLFRLSGRRMRSSVGLMRVLSERVSLSVRIGMAVVGMRLVRSM